MSEPTPTPRTEAAKNKYFEFWEFGEDYNNPPPSGWEFAAMLERELSNLRPVQVNQTIDTFQTPRTDAVLLTAFTGSIEHGGTAELVDHARRLERELNRLQATKETK